MLSVIGRVLWTPLEGALTELYLGVAANDARRRDLRGKYFHPLAMEYDHPHANNVELENIVWNLCEGLVKDFI